jgi:predicted flap endonuclease-1-like 5' DNA nuclease
MDKFWWLTLGLLIGWIVHWIFNILFCKCKCTNENCSKHGTKKTLPTPYNDPARSNLRPNSPPPATVLPPVTDAATSTTTSVSDVTPVAAVLPTLAAFLTKDGQDNLQVIEGIGPKISELLNNAGIHRFHELATTPVATLEGILKEGGSHFQLANPGTWPEQAALIAKGDIAEFERLIGELKGGVRT